VRNSDGTWAKGTSGNPKGRALYHEKQARYLDIILSTPFDRWKNIVDKTIADAETGDKAAREWLGGYLAPIARLLQIEGFVGVGTPTEVLDALDRVYGDEQE
jgi:hypothetical protein